MNNSQLINQTSNKYEYYTPSSIIEAARSTMGSIDLDPASSETANQRVKALAYYSSEGLEKTWYGNIWLNHPFSRENNPLWIRKLHLGYHLDRIEQACCLTYAATSENWFQPLFNYVQCWLAPRTNFYLPDGTLKKGVTKGSVITYFGSENKKFSFYFSKLGYITQPLRN